MMITVRRRMRKRKPCHPLLGEQPGTTYQNKANQTIRATPFVMVSTR